MIKVAFCMNQGLRSYQQDCIYIDGEIYQVDFMKCPQEKSLDKDTGIFAVCDGMGGLAEGDKASKFVCEKLKGMDIDFSINAIEKALYQIQKEFEKTDIKWSGTTIAGVYLNGKKAIIFNAGDSRVYKYTSEGLVYLSHDHSYVQELVDEGIISYKEAFYHPERYIVTFGIGDIFSEEWESGKRPYLVEDKLKEDELYIICSDGLSDYLTDEEIYYHLYPEPFENFPILIEMLEKVKSDNYSIILVKPEN